MSGVTPHTTACKRTYVYDITLLQHSIPPTWRSLLLQKKDVTVTPCIAMVLYEQGSAFLSE